MTLSATPQHRAIGPPSLVSCREGRERPRHRRLPAAQRWHLEGWRDLGTLRTIHPRCSTCLRSIISILSRKPTATRRPLVMLAGDRTRCGFGLTTIPVDLSANLGDTLLLVENKSGVDIPLHSSVSMVDHLAPVEEVFDHVHGTGYSEEELLGAMVGR